MSWTKCCHLRQEEESSSLQTSGAGGRISTQSRRESLFTAATGRIHMRLTRFSYSVVQQNLTSALILEDDADWDIRIKQQLHDYALSTQALIQPLALNPSTYIDPTFPTPPDPSTMSPDITFASLPSTIPPTVSPYGDGWDLLWLGHCGMTLPSTRSEALRSISMKQPKGRVIHSNDETVPLSTYLNLLEAEENVRVLYPNHTRVTHHVAGAICSLGYAVSQAGARRLLYNLGMKTFDQPFDLMLNSFCEGTHMQDYHLCLTVQPQLFDHHRPAGRTSQDSDITDHGDEVREKAFTANIRYSTKMNVEKLLKGDMQYDDQYPDSPSDAAPSAT